MTLNGLSLTIAAILVLALAWKWRREFSSWKLEECAAGVLLPFLLFAAVLLFVKSPDDSWFPHTFGIAAKLGMVPPGNGPPAHEQAGPVAALAYLPVLLCRTVETMRVAGGLLTGMFLLIPMAWAHRSSGGYRPPFTVLAFVLPYVALACFDIMLGSAGALAAGFGILACAVLFRRGVEPPPGTGSLIVSALLAALSIGSLPMAAPLSIALAAHLWNAWGLRWCGRFLLFFAGACAVLAATLMPLFGARELASVMTLSLFRIPPQFILRSAGSIFLTQGWPILAGLAVLAALRAPQAAAEGARYGRGPWLIAFMAGLFTLPVSLGACARLGTSFCLFLPLFHFVASLSLLLALTAGAGGEERSRRMARGVGVLLAGATIAFAAGRVLVAWRGS